MSAVNVTEKIQQLPPDVRSTIEQLHQTTGMTYEQIYAQFNRELTSATIQEFRDQFPNAADDELRALQMKFASGKVWRDNINLPTLVTLKLVYIGHNGLQASRSGGVYSNTYFLAKERGVSKIIRMNAKGKKHAEVYKVLNPHTAYDAVVGRFPGGDSLLFDSRARFANPIPIQSSIKQLNDMLSIRTITVEEAVKFSSRTTSDGWVIDTDWRCILGYFSGEPRFFSSKRNANVKRGVCTITDESVKESPRIDQSGNLVSPGLTAWTAPEHLIYDQDSFLAFLGPIQARKDDEGEVSVSMSCYSIRPIHATRLDVEIEDR